MCFAFWQPHTKDVLIADLLQVLDEVFGRELVRGFVDLIASEPQGWRLDDAHAVCRE